MKKVLFVLFCCTVFVIGCKKAPQEQVVETEQVEVTTAAPTDVLISSSSVDISSVTQSQGETTAVVSNDVLISSDVATSTDTAAVEVSTEAVQGEIK
ncbi:MAG: hypothetical protein WC234_00865 [Endomicrobiaceae bacterium]